MNEHTCECELTACPYTVAQARRNSLAGRMRLNAQSVTTSDLLISYFSLYGKDCSEKVRSCRRDRRAGPESQITNAYWGC